MVVLSRIEKKAQREMVKRNFGLPFEHQERAVRLPHIIFYSAGIAVLNYAIKKQEVSDQQRFFIRMSLLVLDQVKCGMIEIERQFVPRANESSEEKSLTDLARLYCDTLALCDPESLDAEPRKLLDLAIKGGELVMKREVLDLSQIELIEAFHRAAEALKTVVCDAHVEGEVVKTIKGILANR